MSIKRMPVVFVVVGFLTLSACATVVRFTGGPMVPAADGQVTISSGENGNTLLVVKVEHLALPAKVSPGATTYVVWSVPAESGTAPQNVGALRVDGELTGKLATLTPLSKFQLWVTAEPTATAGAPTGPRVLSASISHP